MKIELEDGRFLTDNSQECCEGCFFVVTKPNEKFAAAAVQKGARLLSACEAIELLGLQNGLKLIGVTGTNGKTTTAQAIAFGLNALGVKCGVSGTCGAWVVGKRVAPKGLTTSQFLETLSYLKSAKEAGCEVFVAEVSSHAIELGRIEGLQWFLKIFTNLTQDHLDFHKTFEAYAAAKSRFFEGEGLKLLNKDAIDALNFDDAGARFYSLREKCEFYTKEAKFVPNIAAKVVCDGEECEFESPLVGEFNLYNLLAAFGAIKLVSGKNNTQIAAALSGFAGVAGRVEVVSSEPLVVVDFAHTPDGIEKVLAAFKGRELVVVFGAGGNRDKSKRPKMGAAVERFAKTAIVTSDNPRDEDPHEIIAQVCGGMRHAVVEVDRKKAIERAIALATNGEAVVILGKGDEDYQEIKGVKQHFSDKEVVQEILAARK